MPRSDNSHMRVVDMRGQGRVYRRPGSAYWWIAYYHNSVPYRFSSRSVHRKDALALLTKHLRDRDEGRLPTRGAHALTVGAVLQQYVADLEFRQARTLESCGRSHAKVLREFFGKYQVGHVTPALLQAYAKQRREQHRKPATINKELGFLRAACRLALKRHQLYRLPQITLLPGAVARQGFFEHREYERLLAWLPDYLQPVCTFAYWTGWRKGEIITLEWRDVDLTTGLIRLREEHSKTQQGRVIGMSSVLRALLEQQWQARHVGDRITPYVFHREGQRIKKFDEAWHRACAAAGLQGKLFHDFRRTAVRNMVLAGVPERVAMQVSGHKTRAIFDRYTIVAVEQTATALEQMMAFVQGQPQKIIPLGRKA